MSEEQPEKEDLQPLTLENIHTNDSIVELGANASHLIKRFGTCTFYVSEDGHIRWANPTLVFIDNSVAEPPEGVEPRFVRPVMTTGRPQYVAMKEDGSLWEVEYPQVRGLKDDQLLETET